MQLYTLIHAACWIGILAGGIVLVTIGLACFLEGESPPPTATDPLRPSTVVTARFNIFINLPMHRSSLETRPVQGTHQLLVYERIHIQVCRAYAVQ